MRFEDFLELIRGLRERRSLDLEPTASEQPVAKLP